MLDLEIVWDPVDDSEGNVRHIAEHDLNIEEVDKIGRTEQGDLRITFVSNSKHG